MLTGNLPFTVEPFNIKSLYNKMMKNEMNAIPEHLSKSGEELLRKLLNPDPVKRISLKEAMEHTWLNEGYANPLKPFPYPNKPTEDQVNPTILRYMNSNMEFNATEVAENIKTNKPSSSLATYYLLLNKVKTMLMKMDPKKEKLKPRIDSKPTIKELKQVKTIQPPQSVNGTTTNGHNQALPLPVSVTAPTTPSQNAQSHNQRTGKTPGSTTITTTNGTNQNTFTLIRNKTDIINKFAIKTSPDNRTVSPIPMITNSVNNSVNSSNAPTNGYSNTISSSNPATTFAGAIKNLTQKYKTMHLNGSIEPSHLNGSVNSSLNNNITNSINASINITTLNSASPNSTNVNGNTPNGNNFHFKTTYISNNTNGNSTNNALLNNSLDIGMNNNTIHNNSNSSGDGNSSNNSESQSISDDRQNVLKPTNNFSNRNSLSTTPTLGKVTNTTNAEWTQMIRLNTVKTNNKSDLNNNDMNISNNKEHLIDTNGSTNTTPHMPVISFPNSATSFLHSNNNSVNGNHFMANRLNKSPLMQKLSSPVTLPAIENNNSSSTSSNNGDRLSPQ